MVERRLVVFGDVEEVRDVERAVVELVRTRPAHVHLVAAEPGSGDVARPPISEELAPNRLRLMLLLAKLADRGVAVSGEDVCLDDAGVLLDVVDRTAPDVIHVMGQDRQVVDAAARAAVISGVLIRPLDGVAQVDLAADGARRDGVVLSP